MDIFEKPGDIGGEASGEAEVMIVEESSMKRKRVESGDSPSSGRSVSAAEELKVMIRKDEADSPYAGEEAEEALEKYLMDGEDMAGIPFRRFASLMRWAADLHKADIENGVDTQQAKKLSYKKLAEAYAERMEETWRWHAAFYRLLGESNRRLCKSRETVMAMLRDEEKLEGELAREQKENSTLKQEAEHLRREKERIDLSVASTEARLREKEESLSRERGIRMELEARCRRLTVELDQLKLRRKQEEEKRGLIPPKEKTQHAPKMVDVSTNTEAREEECGGVTEEAMLVFKPNLLEEVDRIVKKRLKELVDGPLRGDGKEPPVPGPSGSRSHRESGPEPPPSNVEGTWAQKVGRKAARREKAKRGKEREGALEAPASHPPLPLNKERRQSRKLALDTTRKPGRGATRRWPMPPKTAAVTLTLPPGGPTSYAEVLRVAKKEISLEELGISHLEIKQARSGGLIFGVPGADAGEKADCLAEHLRRTTTVLGARVARPTKWSSVRLSGLEESCLEDFTEVMEAIAECGGCRTDEIRCIKVGR